MVLVFLVCQLRTKPDIVDSQRVAQNVSDVSVDVLNVGSIELCIASRFLPLVFWPAAWHPPSPLPC